MHLQTFQRFTNLQLSDSGYQPPPCGPWEERLSSPRVTKPRRVAPGVRFRKSQSGSPRKKSRAHRLSGPRRHFLAGRRRCRGSVFCNSGNVPGSLGARARRVASAEAEVTTWRHPHFVALGHVGAFQFVLMLSVLHGGDILHGSELSDTAVGGILSCGNDLCLAATLWVKTETVLVSLTFAPCSFQAYTLALCFVFLGVL